MDDEPQMRLLDAGARELGINLSEMQLQQMNRFMKELLDWNQRINLTSITDEGEFITKHLLDSLTIMGDIPQEAASLLDIGTGGGFPGIPIQIVREDLRVFLLDSIKKKTEFLLHVKRVLKLPFEVYNMRAEDGARDKKMRERYDVVVSRAVANLPVLSEYCLPYVRCGGIFIAMKSEDIEAELNKSADAIRTLGGQITHIRNINIPTTDIYRKIIVIEKVVQTPDIYPRRAGIPEKRPI